jgi:hypothetical protein
MNSSTPQLTYLKQLMSKEVEKTHKQLDILLTQLDSVQNLLDRVGGAKQFTQSSKVRRSSPADNSYDTLHYKLSECSAAVQLLETTVSDIYTHCDLLNNIYITTTGLLYI